MRNIAAFLKSKSINLPWVTIFVVLTFSCKSQPENGSTFRESGKAALPAAYDWAEVLEEIGDRKVGVVTNHTGLIGETHLVDSLMASGVKIMRVFAPEHGFRGDVPDGEHIDDGTDSRTGLEIVSLYGKNKKPDTENLREIELMIFDIQDVGARFYTYLSTLHYIIQGCSENGVPLLVMDRPNPNIHCLDGPVLEQEFSSFVGLHPVPVVYGMTIGEYARMIVGEKWYGDESIELKVLPCLNYKRTDKYLPPVPPSPNLPTMESIYLYPSLCFFEGTNVSVGRGTDSPFTVVGEPGNRLGDFVFVPQSKPGASLHPKHEGDTCRGYDLSQYIAQPGELQELDLSWLLRMYEESPDKKNFFKGYFEKLAGTDKLRKAIENGLSEEEIRQSWKDDLNKFETIRKKYLIYP